MSNFREMAPQWLCNGSGTAVQKNFKLIKYEHIIYHFEARGLEISKNNYFREIFKFRDFMNTLRNFAKSVFAHIFAKFEYFAKVTIYSKSPDYVLQNDI